MIPEILIVSTGASFISTMLDGKQPHKKSERETWSHLHLGKYFPYAEGIHGFDGTSMDPYGYKREGYSPEMRTVFMAAGPSFKKGHKHDVILSGKQKNAESYSKCVYLPTTVDPPGGRVPTVLLLSGSEGVSPQRHLVQGKGNAGGRGEAPPVISDQCALTFISPNFCYPQLTSIRSNTV